jgi:hypothetical protein
VLAALAAPEVGAEQVPREPLLVAAAPCATPAGMYRSVGCPSPSTKRIEVFAVFELDRTS